MATALKVRARIPWAEALEVAASLVEKLEPYTEDIAIVGSLRRQLPTVGDIELLAIPTFEERLVDRLDQELHRMIGEGLLALRPGKNGVCVYGKLNKLLIHIPSGFPVDIFSTSAECWSVAMVVRTGGTETNKILCRAAISKGWKFKPYGPGYETPRGILRCCSEQAVFEAVGLRYRQPHERI